MSYIPVCPTSWRQDWEGVFFYKLGAMSELEYARVQTLSALVGGSPGHVLEGRVVSEGRAGDPVAFITVCPGTDGKIDLESL